MTLPSGPRRSPEAVRHWSMKTNVRHKRKPLALTKSAPLPDLREVAQGIREHFDKVGVAGPTARGRGLVVMIRGLSSPRWCLPSVSTSTTTTWTSCSRCGSATRDSSSRASLTTSSHSTRSGAGRGAAVASGCTVSRISYAWSSAQ